MSQRGLRPQAPAFRGVKVVVLPVTSVTTLQALAPPTRRTPAEIACHADFEHITAPLEDLACVVCLAAFEEPVELLPCRHLLCRACMEGIVAPTCPACRVVTISATWAHRAVGNLCESLLVRCNVCGWKGARGIFVSHTLYNGCVKRTAREIATREIADAKGDFTAVVAACNFALSKTPKDPYLLLERSAAYFILRNLSASLDDASEGIRHAPTAPPRTVLGDLSSRHAAASAELKLDRVRTIKSLRNAQTNGVTPMYEEELATLEQKFEEPTLEEPTQAIIEYEQTKSPARTKADEKAACGVYSYCVSSSPRDSTQCLGWGHWKAQP